MGEPSELSERERTDVVHMAQFIVDCVANDDDEGDLLSRAVDVVDRGHDLPVKTALLWLSQEVVRLAELARLQGNELIQIRRDMTRIEENAQQFDVKPGAFRPGVGFKP